MSSENLERKLNARAIVMETGMSARPEYYSGLEARQSYLNNKILEGIYQGIEKNYGSDAAGQFAQMVADIPVLTATDFLLNLYKLEARDWQWDKRMLGNERGIYVDGRDKEEKLVIGFATIASALGSTGINETPFIRNNFLLDHGIKAPKIDLDRLDYLSGAKNIFTRTLKY